MIRRRTSWSIESVLGDRTLKAQVFPQITLYLCLIVAILFSVAASAQGQNDVSASADNRDEQDVDKAEFKRWIEYYQRTAEAYEFRLGDESNAQLTVSPKPLMSYAHPSGDGHTHGVFFVWTHLGRAELVGSIWSWGLMGQTRTVRHEFHSLSTVRLEPVRVGQLTWTPTTGIQLTPIPGAASPQRSAALRLAQMRSLAGEFTGFSTPHGRELRLRTLPQPLYRYESKRPDVLDGAVFGMFAEWDPDIILLIEARKTDDDFKWVYGYGRFNGCPLRLEHKGVEVWKEGLVPLRNPLSNFFAAPVEYLQEPPGTNTN
jgi:hypothetical protein